MQIRYTNMQIRNTMCKITIINYYYYCYCYCYIIYLPHIYYLTYLLDLENESTINIINIPKKAYNIKSSKIEFVL